MKPNNKSNLFLIEFICALIVFCFTSAICSSILANAYTRSYRSGAFDSASMLCSSVIDTLKANGGELSSLDGFGGELSQDGLTVYYDREFNETDGDGFAYKLVAKASGSRKINLSATVTDSNDEQLFSVSSAVIDLKGGEADE